MDLSREPANQEPPRHPEGRALPADFDHDPDRLAANQLATLNFSMIGDVHDRVAERLAKITVGPILVVAMARWRSGWPFMAGAP